MIKNEHVIKLLSIPNIKRHTIMKIIEGMHATILSEKDLWNYLKQQSNEIQILKDEKILHQAFKIGNMIFAESRFNHQIHFLNYTSEDYPSSLKDIPSFPLILSLKGNIDCLKKNCVGMIGTRYPTPENFEIGQAYSKHLTLNKIAIVSGLAQGIDTSAAMGSIEACGSGIAVLPNGLDKIYPSDNTKIAQDILNNDGLLVSEYLIGAGPQKHRFLERNRIVAALSKIIIVVESIGKGGTGYTVKFCNQIKKPVAWCKPLSDLSKIGSMSQKNRSKLIFSIEDIDYLIECLR